MKAVTTIQITPEEDNEIALLKDKLGLPSKRAVVMQGIRGLSQLLRDQQRRRRLRAAAALVRDETQRTNREWSKRSSALIAK